MLPNHLERVTWRSTQSSSSSSQHSPDEDTLVVVALPEAAVALVGHGEDVRRNLSHVVLAVSLHGGAVVQARDALVGVHGGNYRTNVGLQAHSTPQSCYHTWGGTDQHSSQMIDKNNMHLQNCNNPLDKGGQQFSLISSFPRKATKGRKLLPPLSCSQAYPTYNTELIDCTNPCLNAAYSCTVMPISAGLQLLLMCPQGLAELTKNLTAPEVTVEKSVFPCRVSKSFSATHFQNRSIRHYGRH